MNKQKLITLRFIWVLLLAATRTLALGAGDFVDFSTATHRAYGTVMKISDNEITVRPQGIQGDFVANKAELKIIKNAAAIAALKPKDGEYSINLMWVNDKLSSSPYIFPNKNIKNELSLIAYWANSNEGASVNIWYDSAFVEPNAVANTKALLSSDARIAHQVEFKDLRKFPEVKNNPEAFSEQVPVYFRVDLLRAVCAFNVLSKKAKEGKRHYFVYADMDVTVMSKDDIFDTATQMDLEEFGIVMAHSSENIKFENSFQIWSNNKPNLLKAAKEAIIDINLNRVNHILSGGTWENNDPNETAPLVQVAYHSYFDMFSYYYHLENWGKASGKFGPVNLEKQNPALVFGLEEINHLSFAPRTLKFAEEYFEADGTLSCPSGIYFPRKIIRVPASRFGGRPLLFDSETLSPRNYRQRLMKSLRAQRFDNFLLIVAVKNNYMDAIDLIVQKLSPKELANASCSMGNRDYIFSDPPIISAIKNGQHKIIQTILSKLSAYPKLLLEMAKSLSCGVYDSGILNELSKSSLLANKAESASTTLRIIFDVFSPFPEPLKIIVDGLSTNTPAFKSLMHWIEEKKHLDTIWLILHELDSDPEMINKLFEVDPKTIQDLHGSLFPDSRMHRQILLKPGARGMSIINECLVRGEGAHLQVLLGDELIGDSEFHALWANTLLTHGEPSRNVLHLMAQNNVHAGTIELLDNIFSEHHEIIKEALLAKDSAGLRPIDLAEHEKTKRALADLLLAVSDNS